MDEPVVLKAKKRVSKSKEEKEVKQIKTAKKSASEPEMTINNTAVEKPKSRKVREEITLEEFFVEKEKDGVKLN